MRKMVAMLLALLWVSVCSAALANDWGVPEELAALFDDSRRYDGYTCLAYETNVSGDAAWLIMGAEGHRQLVCGRADSAWTITHATTTALYQLGEDKADQAELVPTDNGFILRYPGESYAFELVEGYFSEDYVLSRAETDGLTVERVQTVEDDIEYEILLATDETGSAVWQCPDGQLRLKNFNIRLFPRSVEEVRRLNAVAAVIADDALWMIPYEATESERYPVYSAPSEASYRAAEGEASVGLWDQTGLYTMGGIGDWTLVQYEISPDASRVGYIQVESKSLNTLNAVPVVTHTATYLTDDPGVSQSRLASLPADTPLTALGVYGGSYAYVETEISGQTARGFVPLRDLTPVCQALELPALEGLWIHCMGGGPLSDCIGFDGSGRFTDYAVDWMNIPERLSNLLKYTPPELLQPVDGGRYYITAAAPGRFFCDLVYALTLVYDDGIVLHVGLPLREDNMPLRYDDDGIPCLVPFPTLNGFDAVGEYIGGYVRLRPEGSEPIEEEDMMLEISGVYSFHAGDSLFPGDCLTLYENGVMALERDGETVMGEWALTAYDAAWGLFATEPPSMLLAYLDNGYDTRLGCAYDPAARLLTLTDGENSGSYLYIDEAPCLEHQP